MSSKAKVKAMRVGSVSYRAECRTCTFRGPRRKDRSEAEQDAVDHLMRPGNGSHRIEVVETQTSAVRIRLS